MTSAPTLMATTSTALVMPSRNGGPRMRRELGPTRARVTPMLRRSAA